MLFFYALLFSLLCTFVIAVPVDRTHSSEVAGPLLKRYYPPKEEKPHSDALKIPELVKNKIGEYKGIYYRDTLTIEDEDDVIEVDANGNIFPFRLPRNVGGRLKPHPLAADALQGLVGGSWLLMPSASIDLAHRNDRLTFTFANDKELQFQVKGKPVDVNDKSPGPLPAKDTDNEPPSEFDGEWYRELTPGLNKMFADDIVEINKGKVSMWKMSAQPGGKDFCPGYTKAPDLIIKNMGRLVGRWRRVPYGSLESEKRNQVMVVTREADKLHYELIQGRDAVEA